MGYCKQTALPETEPVLLADAKTFLRVSSGFTADDTTITAMIQAAREAGEKLTGRSLAQRTFRQVQDRFPDLLYHHAIDGEALWATGAYGIPFAGNHTPSHRQAIYLSFSPLISVQSISYIDVNGNPETLLPDTDFIVDYTTDPGRVMPLPGTNWPITMPVANAVAVFFTAGYDPNPAAIYTTDIGPEPIPTVTFLSNGSGQGTGATGHVVMTGNTITGIVVDNPGAWYTQPPQVVVNGPGTVCNATAVISNGGVVSVTINESSDDWFAAPEQQTTNISAPGIPEILRFGILNMVAHLYQNRGDMAVPEAIQNLFLTHAVYTWG